MKTSTKHSGLAVGS